MTKDRFSNELSNTNIEFSSVRLQLRPFHKLLNSVPSVASHKEHVLKIKHPPTLCFVNKEFIMSPTSLIYILSTEHQQKPGDVTVCAIN